MTFQIIYFLTDFLKDSIVQLGFKEVVAKELVRGILILFVLFLSWFFYKITQGPFIRYLEKFWSIST